MNPQQDQLDFMKACGQANFSILDWIEPQGRHKRIEMLRMLSLYKNLINEEVYRELFVNFQVLYDRIAGEREVNELTPASVVDLAHLLDDVVDVVYVLMGFANVLGLPFKDGWDRVQASNMAKRQADGKVARREDGKILKPTGWEPPNLIADIEQQIRHDRHARMPWQAQLIENTIKMHKLSRNYEKLDMHIKNDNLEELKKFANEIGMLGFKIRMIVAQRLVQLEKEKTSGTSEVSSSN